MSPPHLTIGCNLGRVGIEGFWWVIRPCAAQRLDEATTTHKETKHETWKNVKEKRKKEKRDLHAVKRCTSINCECYLSLVAGKGNLFPSLRDREMCRCDNGRFSASRLAGHDIFWFMSKFTEEPNKSPVDDDDAIAWKKFFRFLPVRIATDRKNECLSFGWV